MFCILVKKKILLFSLWDVPDSPLRERISIQKPSRRHLFAIKFFLREFKFMLLPYYIYNKLNILGLFRYFR